MIESGCVVDTIVAAQEILDRTNVAADNVSAFVELIEQGPLLAKEVPKTGVAVIMLIMLIRPMTSVMKMIMPIMIMVVLLCRTY